MAITLPVIGQPGWGIVLNQALSDLNAAVGGALNLDSVADGTTYKRTPTADAIKLASITWPLDHNAITDWDAQISSKLSSWSINFASLTDVDVDVPQYDPDGVYIPGTGPGQGDVPRFDTTLMRWISAPITEFAPAGWEPPFFKPIVVLGVGDPFPSNAPDDVLVFDESKPSAPLINNVNTVNISGAAVTLPPHTTATVHTITLTANCAITLPTPVAGVGHRVQLKQPDAGGPYTVTWINPNGQAIKWDNSASAPTLQTAGGAEDIIDFYSMSGTSWKQIGPTHKYTAGAVAGPTPTLRGTGTFTANSGASNGLSSVSTTLPTGIAPGDIIYLMVSYNGVSGSMLTQPSINGASPVTWTVLDGPTAGSGQTFWMLRRVVTGTEGGTSSIGGQTITSGTFANGRPEMTGIVVAGGTTTGEVVVSATKSTVSTTLTVPSITPGVANSLLIHFSGSRSSASTTTLESILSGSASFSAGWTKRADHTEGRLNGTDVNFNGFCQTQGLTGGAGSQVTSTTDTYAITATDRSYVIAVPPPVA